MLTAVLIILALLLLALNAFFVLSEFAYVKVRRTQLDEMAEAGDARARLARTIVDELDVYLSTCQLGITIASLGLGWIAEPAFARLIQSMLSFTPGVNAAVAHTIAFILAFTFVTMAHVVLGELAPKGMAIRAPEWYAVRCAYSLDLFHRLFFYPMYALTWLANQVLTLFGIKVHEETELKYSTGELKRIMGISYHEGALDLENLILFENLFDFDAETVRNVMKPLDAVDFYDEYISWRENIERFKGRIRSRMPVAAPDGKAPTRYVHLKDLMMGLVAGDPPKIESRPLLGFRADMPLKEAFRRMRAARTPIAVVTSPDGAAIGIVTMEDMIEEVFGEINDEHERPASVRLSEYFIAGAVRLDIAATNKSDAIAALVDSLCRATNCVATETALAAVLQREKVISTALGHGIALPHARIAGLEKPFFTIGVAPAGISMETPDGRPVKILLVLVTPAEAPAQQIRILSRLSKLFSDEDWRAKIARAESADELRDIIDLFDQMTLS